METVEAQERWAKETVATHGWNLERTFSGVASGKAGVRRVMHELLDELRATPKARRPRRILMVRLDRTGRGDTLELIATIAEIRRLGVTIYTRTDGDIRLENVKDSIKPIFEMIQAGLENEARSDRSRAGHETKRRAGKHAGHAPYGTVLKDGKPQPYEPEAAIVRAIFERRLQRWGTQRLARYAAAHAPPKRRADGGTRKLQWGENTIGRMLACRTYRGIVVDEELFDAVQAIRHAPIDRTAKYEWPLRGAIRCTCGHLLSTAKTGTGKRIRYYGCRNVAVHERYPLHRADSIEAQFTDLLGQLVATPELIAGYREPETDTDSLQMQWKALEKERQGIAARKTRAWEAAEQGGLSPADLRVRIADLNAEEQRITSAIVEVEQDLARANASARTRKDLAATVAQLADAWTGADVDMRREIAKTVAEIFGGLWLEPPPPRGASHSRLMLLDARQ